MTRIDGHGTITLPHDYVAGHVHLGYAATEPGNQSDTTTRSITLATPATTCRGLYVAITRGQMENLILVVTDTHDLADAIDTLQHILTTDRADHPATRTRHELAAAVPTTATTPRCDIPDWFHDLHHTARADVAEAHTALAAEQQRDTELQHRIGQLARQLADIEQRCAPHDLAIARITNDLHQAQERQRDAERALATTGPLHRRTARHTLAEAATGVATARTARDGLMRRAQPLLDQRNELRTELHRLEEHVRIDRQLARSLNRYDNRLAASQHCLDALDTWANWATGHDVRLAALINAAHHLQHTRGAHQLLEPLQAWLHEHDLTPRHPVATAQPAMQHEPRRETPGLDIGM